MLRLWLPAIEFEENSETQYAKGASKEQSKGKKRPKEYETDAFRRHATECSFDLAHSFFSGKSAAVDEAEGEDGEMPSEGAAASTSTAEQTKQNAGVKRKVADALDASDDEDDTSKTKPKKKKSASSMASARARFLIPSRSR